MSTNESTNEKPIADAPAWLKEFVELIAEAYECVSGVGWKWTQGDDETSAKKGPLFEVIVYPHLVEVQGEVCMPSDIQVDVSTVLDLFEQYDDISMSLGCSEDVDHLSVEGCVDGHDVWLRLLHAPPEGEVPTMRFGAHGLKDIPESDREAYVEAGNPEQDVASADELAKLRASQDLAMQLALAWKAERVAPNALLDRLEKLLLEDDPS
jgi:hypothetical protein